MDAFDASKPDRFHHSLSSAWAAFLGAQQCSHEVAALRKTLEQHVQQTNLAISSLQNEAANRHDVLSTAVAESKSKIEQQAVELKEAAALKNSLSTLQQEISDERKDASRKLTELSKQVVAQQEGLDGLQSGTSREIKAMQEQHRLALEQVASLQKELREARTERADLGRKLAALESRIQTIDQTRQALSQDNLQLLNDILSRRDELMGLLDAQHTDIGHHSSPQPYSQAGVSLSQDHVVHEAPPRKHVPVPASQVGNQGNIVNNPPIPTKRTLEEPPQPPPKRPAPSNNPDSNQQDIRALYLVFRDRYKADPPKSDTAFIWEFLGSIENPGMAKHIQDSLAALLPEHVTPSRGTRRKNPNRHVVISKGLTWRKFREALVRIPGPP